jgi:hypothetical protein
MLGNRILDLDRIARNLSHKPEFATRPSDTRPIPARHGSNSNLEARAHSLPLEPHRRAAAHKEEGAEQGRGIRLTRRPRSPAGRPPAPGFAYPRPRGLLPRLKLLRYSACLSRARLGSNQRPLRCQRSAVSPYPSPHRLATRSAPRRR